MTLSSQKKIETAGCHVLTSVFGNDVSEVVSCEITEIKIKEADAFLDQNKPKEAYGIYKNILSENPRQPDALVGIGLILEKQKRFDLAIQFLSKAIESDPTKIQILLARGRLLRLRGLLRKAIGDFTEVLKEHPDNFEALIARGITFGQTNQFKKSISDFCTVIKLDPNHAKAYYNRGVAYEKMYEFEAAVRDYSIAIKLNPHDYKAYNNRGVVRRENKHYGAALKDFEKSTKINPDFAEGYYNKSLTLLSVGNLREGFELYEHRWRTAHFQAKVRPFTQPLWLGKEELKGKTILLHSEQGLGDSIQFCRYIRFFEYLECRVLLEIEKPLMDIMECLLPKEHIFEKNSHLPDFDFHCPLMSLPIALDELPGEKSDFVPYLFAKHSRAKHWRQRLGDRSRPRVGIVWRGNPNHPKDQKRSAHLSEFIEKLTGEIDWLSLQYELPADENLSLNNTNRITHLGLNMSDFSETAAICENLDAAVCIDSSVAHLMGAMGKPVNLILPYSADFRWQNEGITSQWYPMHTLTRAKKNQNVSEVFATQVTKVARSLLSQATLERKYRIYNRQKAC